MAPSNPGKYLALAATVLGLAVGTPAKAVTISNAVLEAVILEENVLATSDLNTRVARFLLECLCDAITGQRGAGGTALAEGGALATTPGHPPVNWFGDTGFLSAVSSGTGGNLATAFAQNKPRGKIVEAGVTGTGSAEAFLTWNGDVKFVRSATTGTQFGTSNTDDPTAQQVQSATITFTYAMEDTGVSAGASGSGSVGIEFSWNGETTFNGGASFDQDTNDGAPAFSGGLAAFAGNFNNTDFSIESDDLDISQEVTLALNSDDILSFFGSGSGLTTFNACELTMSFSGAMSAAAANAEDNGGDDDKEVPEPGSLPLIGICLAGFDIIRLQRGRQAR